MDQSLRSQEREVIEAFANHELIGTIKKSNPDAIVGMFRKLVARCLIICSIKNEVDELTLSVMWDVVQKNYGNYTFQEIERAVIFNQSGKLDQRIDHFQAFDIQFLSSVMDLWLILKTRTRQRVAALLPSTKIVEPSPETLYDGLCDYVQKNKSFPIAWNWTAVYSHMEECLMIPESNDDKRMVFDTVSAKENDEMELKLLSVSDFIQRQKLMDGLEDRIKSECRKVLAVKHLKHLLK